MTSVQNPRLDYVFSLENTHPPSFRAFHPDGGTGTQPPPTIPGKLTRSQDPCPSAVKERYTAAMAQRGPFFCHGRNSCTFPVNRFRVSAQFSAVSTVPDALGVDGTRFTFSPRLTVFAFPTTVLPSFQLFSPSFQLFAPFPDDLPVLAVKTNVFPQLGLPTKVYPRFGYGLYLLPLRQL